MSRDVTGRHSTRARIAQPPRNSWRSPSPDREARRRVKQPDNACDISRNRFPVPRPGVRARPGPPGEGGRGRRLFDDVGQLLTSTAFSQAAAILSISLQVRVMIVTRS